MFTAFFFPSQSKPRLYGTSARGDSSVCRSGRRYSGRAYTTGASCSLLYKPLHSRLDLAVQLVRRRTELDLVVALLLERLDAQRPEACGHSGVLGLAGLGTGLRCQLGFTHANPGVSRGIIRREAHLAVRLCKVLPVDLGALFRLSQTWRSGRPERRLGALLFGHEHRRGDVLEGFTEDGV